MRDGARDGLLDRTWSKLASSNRSEGRNAAQPIADRRPAGDVAQPRGQFGYGWPVAGTTIRARTTRELQECLESGSPEQIADAARELAKRHDLVAGPALRAVLISTTDAMVRNAVALALSDLRDPDAFAALVTLIRSPETRGARGTLLYALGPYDCAPILPVLVDCVIEGGWEEAREAMGLITSLETELSNEVWLACTERVRVALDTSIEERRPLLEELLELFSQ